MDKYDTHIPNAWVRENRFLEAMIDDAPPPALATVRDRLPVPIWEGHDSAIDCYWRAWELAFGNLRTPVKGSGFVTPFIDTAFNNCLFMWDSAFALMFGKYGIRAFDFQQTLDNFYAHQHKDGYICRELREADGMERFERFDPAGTGPNIMPWCEWEHFGNTADLDRLAAVFPALMAYSQWFRKHRTWQNGTYWASGWGCGMDNQPRLPAGCHVSFEHGHMSWIDTTCQQVFANRILIDMAKTLQRDDEVADLETEIEHLTAFVNENMWNETQQFYVDRYRNGSLSNVKSIAGYWALLADIVPDDRKEAFIGHLSDQTAFNRPHRVPSLSADHPQYDPDGGYWCGAVWAPTTYMVLRGLTRAGCHDLAHEISRNHLENVVAAFVSQGTLFENYAPERAEGKCKRDFVGWTGLPPIAVLFEYVFGIRTQPGKRRLEWDIRLLEGHGIEKYPVGQDTTVNLYCAPRGSQAEAPVIQAQATHDLELIVKWTHGQETLTLTGHHN